MTWVEGAVETPLPTTLLPLGDHLSFSQVVDLVPGLSQYGCARKWAYSKRLGLPFTAGPMLVVGSAADEGVNRFLQLRMSGMDVEPALASGEDRAMFVFDDEKGIVPDLGDPTPYADLVLRVYVLLATYYADTIPAGVQIEHRFGVSVADGRVRPVLGFSDVLLADGTIIDNKVSGKPRWTSDGEWDAQWVSEKRLQLATYWTARTAEEKRGDVMVAPVIPSGRLVVAYANTRLRTPQLRTLDLTFDESDKQRVLDNVRAADAVAVSGRYSARPGEHCRQCFALVRCRDDSAARDPLFSDLTGIPEEVE